ncbi:hypothetical protein PGTUg99_017835 [Puccinia graminis f. sp. tritici]|uniref:Uncharacterized protein n=1 Tax=Puccinia graminis f. sp. tritici TaxID=56615 RepID=A0A5B0RJR0_PUCGR|nr:hypothetical protein PGTUg99_017835 [Puccinia graminis f. sp. tritici]
MYLASWKETLPAGHWPRVSVEIPGYPLWKGRRALGDFLSFSAPQHVLLRFVVRGNLLDGLVAPPQYTLNPRSAVGRDPRRPPMPGFPAPACVASAPRAFRISAASIPHAPNKPAKALAKARSRHHTAGKMWEMEHPLQWAGIRDGYPETISINGRKLDDRNDFIVI